MTPWEIKTPDGASEASEASSQSIHNTQMGQLPYTSYHIFNHFHITVGYVYVLFTETDSCFAYLKLSPRTLEPEHCVFSL